jgi:hypothetical protein
LQTLQASTMNAGSTCHGLSTCLWVGIQRTHNTMGSRGILASLAVQAAAEANHVLIVLMAPALQLPLIQAHMAIAEGHLKGIAMVVHVLWCCLCMSTAQQQNINNSPTPTAFIQEGGLADTTATSSLQATPCMRAHVDHGHCRRKGGARRGQA